MKTQEFISRLNNIESELPTFIGNQLAGVGNNLCAEIEDRVIKRGVDYRQITFSGYSTKDMLVGASSFRNKTEANKYFKSLKTTQKKSKKDGGTDYKSPWKTIKTDVGNVHLAELVGGYKELRGMQGMKNNFKTFSYTGDMWLNFKARVESEKLKITLFVDKPANEKKAEGNSKREGVNIFQPSEEEIENATVDLKEKIMTFIINSLK